MKISTKGRYAVRLMYDLAVHHTGDWVALKDVSRRQGISVKYLEQIVRQLSICGYLKSLRGPHGDISWQRNRRIIRSMKSFRLQREAFSRLPVWMMRSISAGGIMSARPLGSGKAWDR